MAEAPREASAGALHLRELEEQYVEMESADADWLVRTHGRHIEVSPRPGGERSWLLRVGRICGVVALPSGRRLHIEPRVPVRNIWTLMALAGDRSWLGWPPAAGETLVGLVDGLMEMFVREMELLTQRGVAVGYRPKEGVLRSIRGRLDVQRQVRELPARPERFACRYAEFSPETPENRVLAAALQVVMRAAPIGSDLRAAASRCLRAMGCREDLRVQAHEVATARVTAATRHYRIPLSLARLLLDRLGAGHRPAGGARRGQTPSLLVEMPRLFERFLCRTLEQGLAEARVRWAGHSVALDDGSRAMLTPDAVVEGLKGPLCVVDAKYKPEPTDRHEPSASDLYQMLAYCVGYGVRHAVLVYPRTVDATPLRIRREGFCATIHPLGLDLSADAHTLRPRSELLCAQVAELAGLPARSSNRRSMAGVR